MPTDNYIKITEELEKIAREYNAAKKYLAESLTGAKEAFDEYLKSDHPGYILENDQNFDSVENWLRGVADSRAKVKVLSAELADKVLEMLVTPVQFPAAASAFEKAFGEEHVWGERPPKRKGGIFGLVKKDDSDVELKA